MALILFAIAALVLFIRWRVRHAHRRGIEVKSNLASLQPMMPWSARFARYPAGRGRGRRRSFK